MLTLAGIDGELIPIVAIGGVFAAGIVAIVFTTMQNIATTNAKERSRREIAAYIAEGSISPDEGERLLKAGEAPKKS